MVCSQRTIANLWGDEMKKAKNPMSRFRSAIRLIWSRSAERKAIIKAATINDPENGKGFNCPLCGKDWPIGLATVDHDPALGSLNSISELSDFTQRMFYGSQRVLCQMCHKKHTAEQRRKK